MCMEHTHTHTHTKGRSNFSWFTRKNQLLILFWAEKWLLRAALSVCVLVEDHKMMEKSWLAKLVCALSLLSDKKKIIFIRFSRALVMESLIFNEIFFSLILRGITKNPLLITFMMVAYIYACSMNSMIVDASIIKNSIYALNLFHFYVAFRIIFHFVVRMKKKLFLNGKLGIENSIRGLPKKPRSFPS